MENSCDICCFLDGMYILHTHIHTMHVHTHIHTMHVHTYMHTHMHICNACTQICSVLTHADTHAPTHPHPHTHTHTPTPTHIHAPQLVLHSCCTHTSSFHALREVSVNGNTTTADERQPESPPGSRCRLHRADDQRKEVR